MQRAVQHRHRSRPARLTARVDGAASRRPAHRDADGGAEQLSPRSCLRRALTPAAGGRRLTIHNADACWLRGPRRPHRLPNQNCASAIQAQQHDLRAPQPDPHTSTARPASLTQHAQLTARRAQQRKAGKLEKAESTRAITHPPPPAGPQEYTSDTAAFLAGCGGDIKGAVATGHRRLASIRSLFSFAHALGYVQFNHAASVDGAAATGGGKKGVWWRGGRSAAQAPPAFSSIDAGRPRVRSTSGPSGAARGGRMACRTRPPSSGPLKLAAAPTPELRTEPPSFFAQVATRVLSIHAGQTRARACSESVKAGARCGPAWTDVGGARGAFTDQPFSGRESKRTQIPLRALGGAELAYAKP